MKRKKLALTLALLCLLGPLEPVFADGDINSQFPDAGFQSAASSNTPWAVESWTGGRRRVKRFNGNNPNGGFNNPTRGFDNYAFSPSSSPSFSDRPKQRQYNDAAFNAGFGGNTGRPLAGAAQYQNSGTSYSPQGRGSSAIDRLNALSNGLMNGMPLGADGMDGRPRRPDKFADNPQVDDSGIRHFANGRHYDLKTTTMDQALADSAASDLQIKQDQMLARMRQRSRNRNF